jgi:hypothetical protein
MNLTLAVKKGDAPAVIGIGRRSFEKYILPLVTVHPIGNTKLIDRVELNQAWEQYKRGCTGRPSQKEGEACKKVVVTTSIGKGSTSSTSNTLASVFSKQLATAKAKRGK